MKNSIVLAEEVEVITEVEFIPSDKELAQEWARLEKEIEGMTIEDADKELDLAAAWLGIK